MRIKIAAVSVAVLGLSACSTVQETLQGPQLAPIGYPAALVPTQQAVIVPQAPTQAQAPAASAASLWRAGARNFFNDPRARNVGDIVTVAIEIDDKAQVQNTTTRSRSNNAQAGVNNLFGFETNLPRYMPGGFDASSMVDLGGSTDSTGTGSVNRSEKINLTVAAVVTAVLPNGNMVIQGRQEVRTNREVRELTVAGVVRPEDVSSANTIRHDQIAEARISYGGRGDISRVQGAPAGQALVERFSPF